MKLKAVLMILLVAGQLFFLSCTSTPYHRDQADIHLQKGVALLQAGKHIGALGELLEAEKNAPDDPEIRYYLGIAYLGRGLKDQSMEQFQKAVSLKEDYSEAHNYIGVMQMDAGEWQPAIDSFDRALKNYLYPTPAFALYNSGVAYYNLQNYDMALSRFQRALSQDGVAAWQPQVELNIGRVYIQKANYGKAKEHLEKAVALNPSLFDAHFYLGETYLKLRDKAKAKKSFEQVIKLAPKSALGQKSREYLKTLP
ncbi:MAG: tetratricopeptide repeat protein [Smithellaceae bacterium]|jgi:Tfp pilus assembly protein PilF|nr:tetratricopeptide repeat protein [Smithellaceae bacterium]MDD3260262.1 tetratricopeptide repeat protein [Smithellaceae bacterium]MDD3849606.1 tetratricopeptide repeat protein [Smithellaceae bacterium]HOG12477.1 tetratricopeptide repeat protein [Smithellaceae bacterium]HOQ71934.1 tetratricopeptide repeat protein [Smithellaceae bacterium]